MATFWQHISMLIYSNSQKQGILSHYFMPFSNALLIRIFF
nr:MAG TPA: hypothetical protein [Caudoviricetes sp.]